jgi:hypothetical protein
MRARGMAPGWLRTPGRGSPAELTGERRRRRSSGHQRESCCPGRGPGLRVGCGRVCGIDIYLCTRGRFQCSQMLTIRRKKQTTAPIAMAGARGILRLVARTTTAAPAIAATA